MENNDLRDWLKAAENIGELIHVNEADAHLEIGCISALNILKGGSAILFDNIPGYPSGYRVVSCTTSNRNTVALTFNLSKVSSDIELLNILRQKLLTWQARLPDFRPEVVDTGPVLENVHSGADVDLFEFPTPKWHEKDGGRYIGTGDVVITKDPETDEVNLGTYRIMVHDRKTTGLYISPGKHGRVHYEKYHARGKACPVAVSVGHHPLLFRAGCIELTSGSEYDLLGAIRNEPVRVIREEITGLPIPADSEIVIAGWCPPGRIQKEGPFGEWTGYYASKERAAPVIEVERIYHRNRPVILGSPPNRPPSDSTYYRTVFRSAMLHNELLSNGIPDVQGCWISEAGAQQFIVVSIKQRYAGHAKRAALMASQGLIGGYQGRYVIVVDEDIDPSNMEDVVWAMSTRSDPEKDIDILRGCWSSPLDPMIRKPAEAFFNSRAIINACKPYEWANEFPEEIQMDPELVKKVKKKWFQ